MDILSLIFLACALSMDSFAVALCKGFATNTLHLKHYFIVGSYFGGFSALMPLIGYFLGLRLNSFVNNYDHWIAFTLLTLIGLKMIKESKNNESCNLASQQFAFKTMFLLAMATSIDALAIGISFAFLHINIYSSVLIIGCISFGICVLGLKIGKEFGTKFKGKAEFIGGAVLLIIGAKILLTHLLNL